ncbi:hypothetical protein PR202_gb27211 [Eleusine coracana subsp. coracana]|uniref:DUF3615 domain-containing protein n=1 Tax=Eleusine coracana subsp. coracana TaxID=191504 RepID=A0AAV5FVB1_ELECO|nr:hypothetical protein PR202_gb27211 [Eleusine coracana subsp. coracana]
MAEVGEACHLVGAAPAPFWHREAAKVTEPVRGSVRQPRRSLGKVCAVPGGGPSYKLETADQVQEEEEAQRLLERMPSPAEYAAARSAALIRASAPRRACGRRSPLRRPSPDQIRGAKSSLTCSTTCNWRGSKKTCTALVHENEYVPAPGKVTKYNSFHNGSCWTHGNIVASPKSSGCFSFLPAQRTLFFFELLTKDGFEGVVSCTPLDEPVTEAYSLLGLCLGWGTRRDGSSDCRCKTCDRLVDSRVPFVGKAFPCGHYKAECVCEMCYINSDVLHPLPQKFVFCNGG